ncbi:MAG TPA: GNAT family N-acetyltransferase [Terracidiphilus sp.]|jgi:CelD/BcsL family acetyltransferase involved in cellulose biosynthesis|nr:GNAT family N-acetyltransferase [Terracidiphilus sp.]
MSNSPASAPHRQKAGTRYLVDVLRSEAELERIADDWNRLSETAEFPNAFSTYGWFCAWYRRHAQEHRPGHFLPHVLVLKEGDRIAGLSPFVQRIASHAGLPVRRLEFVTHHADYNDLVTGDDAAGHAQAIAAFLAQTSDTWDVLHLRDLRDLGAGVGPIEQALAGAGLFSRIALEKEGCPFLAMDGDAASLMTRLSAHERRTLRRRRERAADEGLRIRILEHPEEEPGLLERMKALDWQKHLHKQLPTFLGNYPEVFQSLFDCLGPRGWLYVALLESGGKAIAFQFGFRCGNRLWDYAKAYDRAYSRFAPGTLLLPDLLNYAFQHGFKEYDFLRGEETYKTVWNSGLHRRFRVLIWNRNYTSRMRKFFYHDIGPSIRRILRRES